MNASYTTELVVELATISRVNISRKHTIHHTIFYHTWLKEKLSSGFWVKKIKTYPTRARFPNSWCNQPPVNLSQWVDSYLVKSLLFNNNHSSVSSSMLVFSYLVDNNSFQVLKMDFIEHLIINQLGSSINLDHQSAWIIISQ